VGAIHCRGRYRSSFSNFGGSFDWPCDDQGIGGGRSLSHCSHNLWGLYRYRARCTRLVTLSRVSGDGLLCDEQQDEISSVCLGMEVRRPRRDRVRSVVPSGWKRVGSHHGSVLLFGPFSWAQHYRLWPRVVPCRPTRTLRRRRRPRRSVDIDVANLEHFDPARGSSL
jgi:hypothetical protein